MSQLSHPINQNVFFLVFSCKMLLFLHYSHSLSTQFKMHGEQHHAKTGLHWRHFTTTFWWVILKVVLCQPIEITIGCSSYMNNILFISKGWRSRSSSPGRCERFPLSYQNKTWLAPAQSCFLFGMTLTLTIKYCCMPGKWAFQRKPLQQTQGQHGLRN